MVRRATGRAVGVLVDAYGTGNHLPAAFRRQGVDVIHVQSYPEPISRMQHSPNTEVLVQSHLSGTEYVIDTVSVDGRAFVCGIRQYEKRLPANGKPIYNREFPLSPDDPAAGPLADYTRAVLDALRVRNGPAHTEVMFTAEGPPLVESGARVNGVLQPAFHDAAIGVNSADLVALAYVHPETFLARYADRVYDKRQSAVVYNTPSDLNGQVLSVDEELVARMRSRRSVVELMLKRAPGDIIVPTHDLLTSPLRVSLTHPDPQVVEDDYRFIESVRESVYRVGPPGPRVTACGVV